jgi:hypothetical protein
MLCCDYVMIQRVLYTGRSEDFHFVNRSQTLKFFLKIQNKT